jgi:UTP--glucose-1-phosphate uridylyltransferase
MTRPATSNHQKIVKAVIPAAGFGTRMLPITKALPKEMLPVAGKPLIQYAVEEAAASGIETVILVIRNHKSLIAAHFAPDPELESFLVGHHQLATADVVRRLARFADLQFVKQEKPLGLAHAICCARPFMREQEAFVVLLPDVIMVSDEPVTRQLMNAHESDGGSVVAIREVEPRDVERHGIVAIERSQEFSSMKSVRVTGLVEKPSARNAPSLFGVFGRYLLEPAIWDSIARTNPDSRGEIQLTDALNILCRTDPLSGLRFMAHHYDAGDRLGYLKANIELSLSDAQLRPSLLEYLAGLQS